ncbi:Homeobox protein mab-5 [Formica fusca]
MQSNSNDYWRNCSSEEDLPLIFREECQPPQQSSHHSLHHPPHHPSHHLLHHPPHQPLSQQLQQNLFNYASRYIPEPSSLLEKALIHGKKAVTGSYYANPDKYSPTLISNNQITSRDWETSPSSSNQTSPIVECNQSVANLQEPCQQQQIFYEQNYTDHSGSYNSSISISSRPRIQAPYHQTIYSRQQQETNCNNNNGYKQRNKYRDINNTDERRQLPSFDSSTSFAWVNRTNAHQANGMEQKRTRQTYTQKQTLELEKEFHTTQYLPKQRREQLSSILNLSERQIKIWFQNRRMKAKKTKSEKSQNDFSSTTTTPINNLTTNVFAIQREQTLNLSQQLQPQSTLQQFDGAYQNYFNIPSYQQDMSLMQYHNL